MSDTRTTIQKLLAKSRCNSVGAAEAEAYQNQARHLMHRFGITEKDMGDHTVMIGARDSLPTHQRALMELLCRVHDCEGVEEYGCMGMRGRCRDIVVAYLDFEYYRELAQKVAYALVRGGSRYGLLHESVATGFVIGLMPLESRHARSAADLKPEEVLKSEATSFFVSAAEMRRLNEDALAWGAIVGKQNPISRQPKLDWRTKR